MPAIRYRYADIDGQQLFYREAGAVGAPALVLLHGFPASSFMFRDLIPLLADQYHVIAPDHLGFGLSAAPPAGEFTYTFDALAEGAAVPRRTQRGSGPAGRRCGDPGVRLFGLCRTGGAGVRRSSRDGGDPDALGAQRGPRGVRGSGAGARPGRGPVPHVEPGAGRPPGGGERGVT